MTAPKRNGVGAAGEYAAVTARSEAAGGHPMRQRLLTSTRNGVTGLAVALCLVHAALAAGCDSRWMLNLRTMLYVQSVPS